MSSLEDDMGDALVSTKPVKFRPNDELHQAIGQCVGAPGSAPGSCDHVGIPGTVPPACRSHGGLAPLTAAAAKIRMEAIRARLQLELEPAMLLTIRKLMSIVLTEGPFVEGTVVETEALSQSGKVVNIKDGVRIRASDIIRAADRILALSGVTPEVTSLTVSVEAAGSDGSRSPTDPVHTLKQMLEEATDDRLERLARRLGAIPTHASEQEDTPIPDEEVEPSSRASSSPSPNERKENPGGTESESQP